MTRKTRNDARGQTAHIAAFVVEGSLADVPGAAVAGGKRLILDTLGVGLAAAAQQSARIIHDHVESLGGAPEATIIGGGGRRTAAPLAAMANGALVNILDYDGFWHVPTHVLPATLAVAEMTGASGAAALEAFVLASEVADRLREAIEARRGEGAGPAHRGWYHVSLCGPIASALTASKLLGLDVDRTRAAVGIAANASGGFRQNLSRSCKGLLSGNSASAGVHAALLARRGLDGDPTILEARLGFAAALCTQDEVDWTPLASRLGSPYKLAGSLGLKAHPVVWPMQCVIATLQELQEANAFRAADVDWVDAQLSGFSAGFGYPADVAGASFSWPYVLAATVISGTFDLRHLLPGSIASSGLRKLAGRFRFTEVSTDRERLVVHLHDGRELSKVVDHRLGSADTEAALAAKYMSCAALRLGENAAVRLKNTVFRLERLESISSLMAQLA